MSRLEQIEEKINETVKTLRAARESNNVAELCEAQNRLEELFAQKKEAL